MRQSFFYGTVILIISSAFTKLFGFANRIILSRIIGAEGMGLYQMVVPVVYFLITITTFGLPVAIAKKVAEAEAEGNQYLAKRYLFLALLVTGTLSLVVCLGILLGGNWLTRTIFTDSRTYTSLLVALPVIPIASISGIMRGYFQGKHNMIPTAISQFLEQMTRMGFVVIMTISFFHLGVEYATAAAVASITIAELAGFLFLFWQFRRSGKQVAQKMISSPLMTSIKQSKESLHQLVAVSLPVMLSRIIGSIAYVLEPMLVPFALTIAGFTVAQATVYYGQFAGMAVPLLLFPTFLTYSLSVSLVPAVSEAAHQKNPLLVQRRIYQAMRITLVIGAPCAVLLFVFAEPLCELLYGHREVGILLREMAPFSIFLFFQSPLAAALQGLDYANVVFRNTLIGTIVKISAMFMVTIPGFGIHGAVIALNVGITLVTMLHFASLVKTVGFSIEIIEFAKIGAAMFIMGYFIHQTNAWVTQQTMISLSMQATSGLLLYLVLLLLLRVLGQQDIKRIPWIGKHVAVYFPRR